MVTWEALETLCAFLDTLGSTFDKTQWSGYARWQEVFRKAGRMKGETVLVDYYEAPLA